MANYFAILGLTLLFVLDYICIIVWLKRTADIPHHSIRFSMRGLFLGMTIVAVHFGMLTAFLSELAPHKP